MDVLLLYPLWLRKVIYDEHVCPGPERLVQVRVGTSCVSYPACSFINVHGFAFVRQLIKVLVIADLPSSRWDAQFLENGLVEI